MNIRKTKAYYESLAPEAVCDDVDCQNYVKQIRSFYPLVADHLHSVGVDIEKPTVVPTAEPDKDGYVLYEYVQYIVFGSEKGFPETEISGVGIYIDDSYDSYVPKNSRDAYFLVEISPIRLKWVVDAPDPNKPSPPAPKRKAGAEASAARPNSAIDDTDKPGLDRNKGPVERERFVEQPGKTRIEKGFLIDQDIIGWLIERAGERYLEELNAVLRRAMEADRAGKRAP